MIRPALSLCFLLSLILGAWAAPDELPIMTPGMLEKRLAGLQSKYPGKLLIRSLGTSVEGRPIWACRLGEHGPGLLAIVGQHSYEHDMTVLAVDLLEEGLRPDSHLHELLQNRQLVIVPMDNPDGVAQDLSTKAFDYGRNHRQVDLNRNWGFHWNTGLERATLGQAQYPGPTPFSEPESVALRDFILKWPDLRLVVDYHSGAGSFMQGAIHYPYCYSNKEELEQERLSHYLSLAKGMAERLSDAGDSRAPYFYTQVRDVRRHVLEAAPAELRDKVAALIPAQTLAPGAAIDWIEGEAKTTALAIEASRPADYFEHIQETQAKMLRVHIRTLEYLLSEVDREPARHR